MLTHPPWDSPSAYSDSDFLSRPKGVVFPEQEASSGMHSITIDLEDECLGSQGPTHLSPSCLLPYTVS